MLRGFLSRTEAAAGRLTSLTECRRYKSKSVRIANRLRVERFQAVRYTLPTRLDTAAPHIAAEWDFEKNPMNQYPQIVSAGSVHDAWWLCAACGCSFAMSPEKRVLRGGSCPSCVDEDRRSEAMADDELLTAEQSSKFRPNRNVEMPPRSRY